MSEIDRQLDPVNFEKLTATNITKTIKNFKLLKKTSCRLDCNRAGNSKIRAMKLHMNVGYRYMFIECKYLVAKF